MLFRNDDHAELWAQATEAAGAVRDDDTVNSYYAASLFLLTGVPGLYDRVKKHVHNSWIDFEPMLEMGLSTGENIIVALAGNFYNGSFFDRYTPWDIVNHCDGETVELAARAMVMRKQRVDINTVFD